MAAMYGLFFSQREIKRRKDYETDEINETDEKIQGVNSEIITDETFIRIFSPNQQLDFFVCFVYFVCFVIFSSPLTIAAIERT